MILSSSLPLVYHAHGADGGDAHQRQRVEGLGAQHQHIQRVAVIGECARNKAVVGGVVRGGVQDSVQTDKSCFFVQLILAGAASRYFHHGGEVLRGDFRRVNVVPIFMPLSPS